MAHIRVIDEDEAEGDLFEIYDKIQKSRGRLSNIMRIQSLHPKGLQVHLDMYMTLLFGKGPLPRKDRELIAVVVSSANACQYCVIHHSEALGKYIKDRTVVEQLGKDYKKAGIDTKAKALAEYAHELTLRPKEAGVQVQGLRDAGYDDEAILHAAELVAYFNFVNRLAHGLGVDLESADMRDYDY